MKCEKCKYGYGNKNNYVFCLRLGKMINQKEPFKCLVMEEKDEILPNM